MSEKVFYKINGYKTIIAQKDCVLFLWVTMPRLQEGVDTIKAWGFTYKTCGFCWVKQNPKGDGIDSGLG